MDRKESPTTTPPIDIPLKSPGQEISQEPVILEEEKYNFKLLPHPVTGEIRTLAEAIAQDQTDQVINNFKNFYGAEEGQTALIKATRRGHFEIAKLLLNNNSEQEIKPVTPPAYFNIVKY